MTNAAASPDARCAVAGPGGAAASCSLWWRQAPTLPARRLGLIGHYAAADAGMAAELLRAACERLRAEGCTHAVGPMDGSTWHAHRLVTWSAGDPPFLLEPDAAPDAVQHFAAAGFDVLAHYWSSRCDELQRYPLHHALDARLRAGGCSMRPLDPARLDAEIELLWRLASDAFAGNFLYTPVSLAEFREIHAALLPLVRPEFVLFAERHGQAVGLLLALPDLRQAARGEPVDTLVLKTLGVARAHASRGIGPWLVEQAIERARAAGLRRAIFALMHEDNPSRRIGRGVMRDFRRYSLFEKAL